MKTLLNVMNAIMMGYHAKHAVIFVETNESKLVLDVLDLLTKEGFIEGQRVDEDRNNYSKVYRRYVDGVPGIKQVSTVKMGLNKMRVSQEDLYAMNNGLGRYVMSTDKGVMTEQEARRKRVGGYILFSVM